jgi:hypothetical protein
MNGLVTISARSPDFQRTFLAMRYFFGARGAELAEPLGAVGLHPAAAEVSSGLARAERAERARALATELGRLAASLDERGLWR